MCASPSLSSEWQDLTQIYDQLHEQSIPKHLPLEAPDDEEEDPFGVDGDLLGLVSSVSPLVTDAAVSADTFAHVLLGLLLMFTCSLR